MNEPDRSAETRTLAARYVFPITGPPIAGGTVTFRSGRIIAVGQGPAVGRPQAGRIIDLGNVALLPGLVNAHLHLEFSGLSGPLAKSGIGLVDWIRLVMRYRREGTLRRAVECGLRESRRLGVTTLGEIGRPDWPVDQIESAGLDVTVFQELIAPTAERVAATLDLARGHVAAGKRAAGWHPGLSPHAPYSVHPDLLSRAVSLSAAENVPLAFHLAESREELQWLRSGDGPFREFLEEIGAHNPTLPDDMTASGGTAGLSSSAGRVDARSANHCRTGRQWHPRRPLEFLRVLADASRALVIHGNYLDDEEIGFLAERADRMAVVYCPRTHAWFGHEPYPLERMLAAGVRVALGTDSRASAPDLSLLAELRFTAEKHPTILREVILRLGTIRAAEALGRGDEVGSLEPGKAAHFAVVPLPDGDAADPHDLLFESDEPVRETWFSGQRVHSALPRQ